MSKPSVAVIGAGSWGTALVKMLTENDVEVNWWMRSSADREYIARVGHNPRYLSSVSLNLSRISLIPDKREAMRRSDWVLFAVPSAYTKNILLDVTPADLHGKGIISAVKGMVPGEHLLLTAYIRKRFRFLEDDLMFIAGPCHAEEIANERQSYLTLAGGSIQRAEQFARLLRGRYVYVSTSPDIEGTQYAAVFKNVVALAGGIAHSLSYGDNFMAVMVSNAMQEMRRLLDTLVPYPQRDLLASAYAGDLLVTAYSQFSRNRTFGGMIGRGYSVKSAQLELDMVAEGYYGVRSLHKVCKGYEVDLPIVQAVHRMLYEHISPIIEMRLLSDMMR
ncbi:MAG: NAD(P)H-dependent glycerol-3-phosphate dehydrogenase [Bernardetiaceae bacterium]